MKQDWMERAGCIGIDPETFFDGRKAAQAKRVCASCPVSTLCAELGATEEYGIWGGVEKTPAELAENTKAVKAERDETILALLNEGVSFAEIGRRVGMARTGVRQVVERLRPDLLAEIVREREAQHVAKRARVIELHRAGMDTASICKLVGLGETSVRTYASEAA